MGSKTITLEELGKGMNASVNVEIEFDLTPGEPQTWDHPGSPTECELTAVHVLCYTSDTCEVLRDERPDWFNWLDLVVESIVEDDWESQTESILEDEAGYLEDCRW